MVIFRQRKSRLSQYLAGLVLLCIAPGAISAPGFISGSKVTRGSMIADISIQFACNVEYVGHLPVGEGDRLRIQLESTAICNGVSPTIAQSREQHRPLDADKANLVEIDYDGDTASGQVLTLVFNEVVRFDVVRSGTSNNMTVRVYFKTQSAATPSRSGATSTRVPRAPEPQSSYVINLSSSRIPHAASEIQAIAYSPDLKIFETEVILAGITWYRLRVGHFDSSTAAQIELKKLHDRYPTAWIDRAKTTAAEVAARPPAGANSELPAYKSNSSLVSLGLDQVDQLMSEARRAMVAGEISKAVQIYTKVLRAPNHDRHAEAQEYLALAREKNGQLAHAKSEYQRYLSLYPQSEGAARVSQRLAVLLAGDRKTTGQPMRSGGTKTRDVGSSQSDWNVRTFFSQFYRRDVNQFTEQDEIVSQSALYSDINLDARRRGQRFDFSSRLSAGHRQDFLDEGEGSGNDLRVSYAYADLADAGTGLRGRIGRQSRNTGGVLGRFDGLNLGYRATDRILVSTVIGKPVYSASSGADSARTFYGASINYGPVFEDLELGLFYIQQDIEGIDDRQAVGTEFRYFGQNQSLWGLIDYDTFYKEIGSAFLQGSWRFASHLTIHGSIDQRHSPFLSTGNALIGQPVQTFSELLVLMTEDEIRQLSLDRTPLSNTYTVGISHSLTPRLQFNVDANQTTIEATPASGGVAATPETTYEFYAANVTASSLLKEGDVSIIGIRYSTSGTTKSMSLNLDTRIPFGRYLRINPRLRVERRQFMSDSSYEWVYRPGIRIQYRRSQKFRINLEAGKQFSERDLIVGNLDRESYFINIGYQAFF